MGMKSILSLIHVRDDRYDVIGPTQRTVGHIIKAADEWWYFYFVSEEAWPASAIHELAQALHRLNRKEKRDAQWQGKLGIMGDDKFGNAVN